jgi:hypothetical protein
MDLCVFPLLEELTGVFDGVIGELIISSKADKRLNQIHSFKLQYDYCYINALKLLG